MFYVPGSEYEIDLAKFMRWGIPLNCYEKGNINQYINHALNEHNNKKTEKKRNHNSNKFKTI